MEPLAPSSFTQTAAPTTDTTMHEAINVDKNQKVVIIGSGAFGLSTAYHLLERGWMRVTVYDRAQTLPAPDAASADMNKVVRSSYTDPTYTRLTREAVESWKNTDVWGDSYYESGVLIRGEKDSSASVSLRNDIDHGVRIKEFRSSGSIPDFFGDGIPLGSTILNFDGYLNIDSGWANAKQAMELLLKHVSRLGCRLESGKSISGISSDGKGVTFEDGSEEKADIIVIATGSWTPCTFPELGVTERVVATGQCVATIQLSSEEARRYANVPVVLDYTTGFYIFPPHPDTNIVKLAIHSSGYTRLEQVGTGDHASLVSTPRTFMTHENGGAIPRFMIKELRERLKGVYPELGKLHFSGTRLCWYADTPDSNWLIDFHPDYPNSVIFATGGSGHAFKFLPILGRLVADRIENTLEPALAEKFSFARPVGTPEYGSDQNRPAVGTLELDLSDLSTVEDLLP